MELAAQGSNLESPGSRPGGSASSPIGHQMLLFQPRLIVPGSAWAYTAVTSQTRPSSRRNVTWSPAFTGLSTQQTRTVAPARSSTCVSMLPRVTLEPPAGIEPAAVGLQSHRSAC